MSKVSFPTLKLAWKPHKLWGYGVYKEVQGTIYITDVHILERNVTKDVNRSA